MKARFPGIIAEVIKVQTRRNRSLQLLLLLLLTFFTSIAWNNMSEVENHFTVFVRLPFNRGEFVDPPPARACNICRIDLLLIL
jgi:Atg29 N-terminal domain